MTKLAQTCQAHPGESTDMGVWVCPLEGSVTAITSPGKREGIHPAKRDISRPARHTPDRAQIQEGQHSIFASYLAEIHFSTRLAMQMFR